MSHYRHETNPHFIRLQSQDQQLGGPSSPWTSPPYQPPSLPPRRHHGPHAGPAGGPMVGAKSRPSPTVSEPADPRGPPRERPSAKLLPLNPEDTAPPRRNPHPAGPLLFSQLQPEETHPPSRQVPKTPPSPRPRIPPPKRTNAVTWSAAVCCAVFWVILILAGLIVLIVYLVYRPHSPYFDIAAANLNAAYLDMGFLLNADLSVFANFTNPSKKSSIDYNYVTFELYHYNTLIATRYIDSFSVPKRMSLFVTVHLVSSQVRLSIAESEELQKQITNGSVLLNVRGTFHARSNLGSVFRYSYWMHSHCSIALNSPPAGILRGRRCNVNR